MKNYATLLSFALLCMVLLGACKSAEMTTDGGDAPMAEAMSMEESLIAKHIADTGGMASIRALESLRITGEAYMPAAGMTMPVTITQKRPSMMYVEVEIPAMGVSVKNGYDGQTAWSDNPMQGGLQKLSGEQARTVQEQADMDGLLVGYAEKGYDLEYAGEAEVKGAPAHKLKLIRPDSSHVYVYLDAASMLQVKTEAEGTNPMTGGKTTVETFMSDYRDVGGVQMPFSMEVMMGSDVFQTITFQNVETNVAVDEATFMYPKK